MSQNLQPDQILENSRILVDSGQVSATLDRMAQEISAHYQDQPLTLVAVMVGGMLIASWLSTRLYRPLRIDFVHATRYRSGLRGGHLDFKVGPHLDVHGRHVLVVDDIFDEGHTLAAICEAYRERGASSVQTAVLVRKLHERGLDRDFPDFIGLDCPDEYVFGCGMDAWEEWRHLAEIRALHQNKNEG